MYYLFKDNKVVGACSSLIEQDGSVTVNGEDATSEQLILIEDFKNSKNLNNKSNERRRKIQKIISTEDQILLLAECVEILAEGRSEEKLQQAREIFSQIKDILKS